MSYHHCFSKKIYLIKYNWRKLSFKIFASPMGSILRKKHLYSWFSPILLFFFYKTERFLLYVHEIWAHIDIYKCPNLSFKIVAPAVSSILRVKILKLNFLPLYLIKLIVLIKQWCYVFFSSICAWNISSFGHILMPKREI